ncbi:ABC-2 family transporter protein [Lacrimispora sp. BS-2]|uniref:ABC-2 family transporter protein n=1 Tax=Lacrimispora sp. BS-2 TaxID=3151850 RepID=A0AAU7PKD6_9FIRM
MKTLKYYSILWGAYMKVGLLTMIQYPADTIIWIISMLIREASGFIAVTTLVYLVGGLGNWSFYEVCLLFSMSAIIEAIGQTFFDCVWSIDHAIQKGDMDVFLIRPASPFIQLLGQVIHFQALLSMLVYFFIFIWASLHIGIKFQVREILMVIEYVICGTIINSGIYTIFNCLNFWIIQGDDIAILVQTCREFTKYPLHIFPQFINVFFTYLLPLGFVAYYPALYLLNKTTIPINILLPVVAAFVSIIGSTLWRRGIKGYNSTGT